MTQGGLKDSVSILPDKNITVIKNESLKTFIKYYINLITLLGVKHVSSLSDNKQLFDLDKNKGVEKKNDLKGVMDILLNKRFMMTVIVFIFVFSAFCKNSIPLISSEI